ncbi:beta-N-acetylhexosaminidase [Paenibacillus sp. HB172176]|uniref:beta-N-acetylhexosaminidase n=1 Tax=Paenibacillus sp. HB172176 TaxID=2493690 RepID=UPI0014390482|nr:beta-N-acetylhexosaminidase [Paenibacillus sp. HB172176]
MKHSNRLSIVFITALMLSLILMSCSNQDTSNSQNNNNGNTSTDSENHASPGSSNGDASEPTVTATPSPSPSPKPTFDPVQQEINSMSIDEKVGQLLIFGVDGTSLSSTAKDMIINNKIGGFILYKENIVNAKQIVDFLNELKQTNNQSNTVPLWLSVDEEGGRVNRLPSEFKKIPTARSIGDKQNANYTNGIGQAIGFALHDLGFNMDFAPDLDINSNPDNPVIGDRSFGTTADRVINQGIEMMKGISSGGVAAVVKHFPGHGDTSVDSHHDLPIVKKTLEQLSQFELLPFEEAIKEDVDAIMVAHLLMLQIDDQHPASISKAVITDLLRKQLSYDGVVITDDMTMGGLMKGNNIGEAAVASILAGSDLILVGHDSSLQLEVLKSLKQAVNSGQISEERLNESVSRILRLKNKYKLSDAAAPQADVDAINKRLQEALNNQ